MPAFADLQPLVEESRRLLLATLLRDAPPFARHLLEHFPLSGGQGLRPALVLAAGSLPLPDGTAPRRRPRRLLQAAAAIELVHNGSLLHDDVVDRAGLRRHRPTINLLFGDREAVLLGDYLLARAFELALELRSTAATTVFVRLLGDMVEGELHELDRGRGPLPTEEHALQVIRLKTSSLFAAACVVGGIVGGQPPAGLDALRRYGEGLGCAYQVADDVLDATASSNQTGKDSLGDLREGKPTLPLVYALEAAGPAVRAAWAEGRPVPSGDIVPLLHDARVRERALGKARTAADDAEAALAAFPPGPRSESMGEFVRLAWQRASRQGEI